MSRRAVAPDGTAWTVRRRREPVELPEERQPRIGSGWRGWAITTVFAVALVAAFVWSPVVFLVVTTSLVLFELADQIRKGSGPWLVEASAPDSGRELAWRVHGRRGSRAFAAEVARRVERGQIDLDLPGAERVEPPPRAAK